MIPSTADVLPTQDTETLNHLVDRAHACERESHREEVRRLYELALYRLTGDEPTHSATSIVRWIARTYIAEAEHEAARDCLELSLALAQLAGDETGIGHSMNQLAILHWRQGDLNAAKRLYLSGARTRDAFRRSAPGGDDIDQYRRGDRHSGGNEPGQRSHQAR